MAMRVLLNCGNASANKWLLSSIQCHRPKAFRQTTLPNVRYFRKLKDTPKQTNATLPNVAVETGPIQSKILWKAFGFSIMFSGASIVVTTIWEYEHFRAQTYRLWNHSSFAQVKRTGWRATIHNWWHSLDEGKKLFIPICIINVLVTCAWRIPALQSTMLRYFCSNPASSAICWPMVLSTFSHASILHLAVNMFVLNSFCSPGVSVLGKQQFLALYLTSGVMSSFASYFYKTIFARPGFSLGASGAIMGILGFTCTQFPETQLHILLLPMYTFAAGSAIKVIVGMDTLGCIMGWRFFDHAAHLGGAACGIFWQKWGNANIWQQRRPLVNRWHEFRESSRSR